MRYNQIEKEFNVLPMSHAFGCGKPGSAGRILLDRQARHRSRYPAAAMILLLSARPGGAPRAEMQTEHPLPMQVTSNAVEVDVTARNARGDYVEGLKASDFDVYENDVPQKITLFVPARPGREGFGGRPTCYLTYRRGRGWRAAWNSAGRAE